MKERDYPCDIPILRREEIQHAGEVIAEASFMLHSLLRDTLGSWNDEVANAIRALDRAKVRAHVSMAEIGLD